MVWMSRWPSDLLVFFVCSLGRLWVEVVDDLLVIAELPELVRDGESIDDVCW